MAWARRALPDALAATAVALLILAWFGHAFLNYDTFYALLWGDDLVHGRTPQYQVAFAPTPHPLATAVGAGASLFGDAGEGVMLGVALIVWAAVLEVRRPRRGWPVLLLLALAGLLRPEAWLFIAVYWLWLFPSRDWPARLRLAALALAAPAIWLVSDLLVTGDALWSL